jgi:alkanesulfonate monooxygenase SsuD/methylene tetrahydromethanopterin reductase-like flavin-dependent oxidoreductase (luciferase family)
MISVTRIGFLAFVEHTGITGTRSAGLDEGFALFERAAELGYDAGWVRVRHLEPYLSGPLPFLTAVAQRVPDIRLGTSVIPLRYESPVRLAEDAATADLLTGGRLHLGLSAGYTHSENVFGPVFGESEVGFDEEVDRRLRAFLAAVRGEPLAVADATLAGGKVVEEGQQLTAQPLSPTLPERLSYGAGRHATAVRTGNLGLGLQLSTLNTESTEESFEAYQERVITDYRAAHRAATGRDGDVSVGRMVLPVLRDSDRDDYGYLIERSNQRQAAHGTPGAPPLRFGVVHAGSPEEILAGLAADQALRAADELVVVLPFGHAPEVSRRIIETVAETVIPALRQPSRTNL